MRSFRVVLGLIAECLAANDLTWSYTNDQTNSAKWATISPDNCSGMYQSPIALDSKTATYFGDASRVTIDISKDGPVTSMTMTALNNGHSLAISFGEGSWNATLNAAEAEDYYKVHQVHFHWGSNTSRGSEHTLDGRIFPLEMHMVTYSSRYANFSSAHVASGGMAVIGVFFKLTTEQSKSSLSKMGSLLSKIDQLTIADSEVLISSFNPKVLLPADKHHFFRYQGSLTTPPCTETVQWTVMRNPLYVTSAELEKLRSLRFGPSDKGRFMQDNFRPVQPLNRPGAAQLRVLYKSWSDTSSPLQTSSPYSVWA